MATRWVTPARSPGFLFPVRALSRVIRGKFLETLATAETAGILVRDPATSARFSIGVLATTANDPRPVSKWGTAPSNWSSSAVLDGRGWFSRDSLSISPIFAGSCGPNWWRGNMPL